MIDLDGIRKRDRDYDDVFEAQASMSKDIAHRLVAWPVADRRALLAYVDRLQQSYAELDAKCGAALDRSSRLTDELAAAERNAARYRWLRDNAYAWGSDALVRSDMQTEPAALWLLGSTDMTEAGIDAAIDAAMLQDSPQSGPGA